MRNFFSKSCFLLVICFLSLTHFQPVFAATTKTINLAVHRDPVEGGDLLFVKVVSGKGGVVYMTQDGTKYSLESAEESGTYYKKIAKQSVDPEKYADGIVDDTGQTTAAIANQQFQELKAEKEALAALYAQHSALEKQLAREDLTEAQKAEIQKQIAALKIAEGPLEKKIGDEAKNGIQGANSRRLDAEAALNQNVCFTTTAGIWNGGVNIDVCFLQVTNLFLKLSAFFLWFSGVVFEYVITTTIVNLKETLKGIGGITAAWETGRNFANVIFIFILIYAAIKQVLFQEGSKKIIFQVILFAFLLNFSLFFTNVIIDASNFITIGVYNEIITIAEKETKSGISEGVFFNSKPGISDVFMNSLNLASIYDFKGVSGGGSGTNALAKTGGGISPSRLIIITLGGAVLMLITGTILLSATFLFAWRFIVFVLCMAWSPLAYAAKALPGKGSGYFSKYMDPLLAEAQFAPLFMIFLLIAIKIITSEAFKTTLKGTGSLAGILSGDGSAAGLILNFVIVIGFLTTSMVVAKETGAKGADAANKFAGKMKGYMGAAVAGGAGFATGAAGFAARNSIGRAASVITDKDYKGIGSGLGNSLRSKASESGVFASLARRTVGTADVISKQSFDARNISVVGGAIGKGSGEGGFIKASKDSLEARVKKEEANAELYGGIKYSTPDKDGKEPSGTGKDIEEKQTALDNAIRASKAKPEDVTLRVAREDAFKALEKSKKDGEAQVKKQQVEYASNLGTGIDKFSFWNQKAREKAREKIRKDKRAGKDDEDTKNKLTEDELSAALETKNAATLDKIMSEIKDNAVKKLNPKILKNPEIIKRMAASHFRAIVGELSKEDRKTIYTQVQASTGTLGALTKSALAYFNNPDPKARENISENWDV